MDAPKTWEEIDRQIERLRAMEAAPQGSLLDIIQKAAYAITLKDYQHLYA